MDKMETLKQLYTALNRDDMAAVLALLDPDIERIEPSGFPTSGTYRGLATVAKHFVEARATWADGGCTPERILVSGDKLVAFVHVRVKLKATQNWVEGRVADGFVFRNGKITFMQTFLEPPQALAWAGLAGS